MVTDSAKKGRWRNSQGWIDSLQPCFLATEVGIGRKIMIVVAFYVAAPQNKNEVTSLEDRSGMSCLQIIR